MRASASPPLKLALYDWLTQADGSAWNDGGQQLSISVNMHLAVIAFNNRDASVLPVLGNLGSCKRNLTIAAYCDTRGDPKRALASVLSLANANQVDCVIGPQRSAEAEPMAIALAVVNQAPMVSHWATAPKLAADRTSYPYFTRTVPSDSAPAAFVVQMLLAMGYKHFAFSGDTTDYGLGWADALAASSQANGITFFSDPYTTLSADLTDTGSLASCFSRLQTKQANVLVLLNDYSDWDTIASAMNVSGTLSNPNLLIIWTGFSDQAQAAAVAGSSPLVMSMATGSIYINTGIPETNPVWTNFQNNIWSQFTPYVNYLNSNLPPTGLGNSFTDCLNDNNSFALPADYFASGVPPQGYYDFMAIYFDAVIAAGLGMCDIAPAGPLPNGANLFNAIVNQDFIGMSGRVNFNNATGDRNPLTTVYYVWNIYKNQSSLSYSRIAVWDELQQAHDASFSLSTSNVVFKGGLGMQPPDLTPPVENFNYLPAWARPLAYSFVGILNTVSVACVAFIYLHWNTKIVNHSQPEVMLFIAVGCVVMTWSIIGLVADDQEPVKLDPDAGCMVTPVLFAMGFQMAMAGIMIKTWRILMLFKNSKLRRRAITSHVTVSLIGALAALELLILLVWIGVAPLKYQRIVTESNSYGFPMQSYGWCGGGTATGGFAITVFVLHGLYMLGSAVLANRVRDLPAEYQESRFIQLAIFALCLIYAVAIPGIIAVYVQVVGRFVVILAVIVTTVLSVVGSLFVPKIITFYFPTMWRIGTSEGDGQDAQVADFTRPKSSMPHKSAGGGSNNPGASERVGAPGASLQVLDFPGSGQTSMQASGSIVSLMTHEAV